MLVEERSKVKWLWEQLATTVDESKQRMEEFQRAKYQLVKQIESKMERCNELERALHKYTINEWNQGVPSMQRIVEENISMK